MTTWFTADTHFGHTNVIKFCNRPFSSVEDMDDALINNWNSVVKSEDVVYHLGDFTLKNLKEFKSYCRRLSGNILIVPGGHDHRWIEQSKSSSYVDNLSAICYTIEGTVRLMSPLLSLELNNEDSDYPSVIVLCHYAMRVWDRSHYGSIHLYGHSHGNLPPIKNTMDVGVDVNNFYPISLEEVLERFNVKQE